MTEYFFLTSFLSFLRYKMPRVFTSFLLPIGILSNKHRISCYTPRCPRVFSINFIVFASLLREGIETLPDYYFVNFVLFTIHGIFGIKFFKNPQIIQSVQFIKINEKILNISFQRISTRNSRYSSRYSVVIQ